MIKLLFLLPTLVLGANLLLLPKLMRRGRLFAVPVAAEFLGSGDAKRAIGLYRTNVAVGLTMSLCYSMLRPDELGTLVAVLLALCGAAFGYYRAHRLVAPFRMTSDKTRWLEVDSGPDTVPRTLWLMIGPFVILLFTALFVNSRWDSIPATFPVHWGADGAADRWAVKGIRSVFGPLGFGAELCGWFVLSAFAAWWGARRSTLRAGIVQVTVAVQYLIATLFSFLGLLPVLRIPGWLVAVVAIAPCPLLIWFMMNKAAEPTGAPEATSEENWKLGLFYYNPNDMALVVEKRVGFGYTFNFANRWCWALMGALVLVVATIPLLLL